MKKTSVLLLLPLLTACAVTAPPQQAIEAPVSRAHQVEAQKQAALPSVKTFKRKIAIGRFSNETRYGRTFQVDADQNPLGKQASDMLTNRLVSSNRFLVFERPDLAQLQKEQAMLKQANLIGVDALVLGSVTEFGRSTSGKSGFLSATKVQTARAKVEIRLADARTGYVFFTVTGTGEASTESGEVAGFGSKADYDGTLNDRAIGAAISDVQNALMAKLEERPWRTDILKAEGNRLFISGGMRQGLKPGDLVSVMKQGDVIRSQQSGFDIALPSTILGKARISSLFGDNESNEGSVAELISGAIGSGANSTLYIAESRD
jgi:curli biogenesis system outer membrane secretion channel CsgG